MLVSPEAIRAGYQNHTHFCAYQSLVAPSGPYCHS